MKWDKPLWVWLLILIAIALVKASVRLIILLVLGLAGLYMLHLLAQDFNKIRNGWPFPARPGMGGAQSFLRLSRGLSKRSTDVQAYNYTADVQKQSWLDQRLANDTVQFPKILHNDPIGCARKYVCHISGKSRKKLTRTASNILALLNSLQWLDTSGEWLRAEELGKKSGKDGACETAYSKCYYTGVQMERFLNKLS
ncbi:Hypothetical protein NTJ_12204 [Nesidiocoris tenuis]|uniref:Uncharacterized protein n=1 Tax=Nesidiocoris tenuis TaxID=355587 RepID=A0ABN7B4R3_9HEMI|nr:Hypothetical protein NTJ_12204 [Nesidiocoris tenuis]